MFPNGFTIAEGREKGTNIFFKATSIYTARGQGLATTKKVKFYLILTFCFKYSGKFCILSIINRFVLVPTINTDFFKSTDQADVSDTVNPKLPCNPCAATSSSQFEKREGWNAVASPVSSGHLPQLSA